MNVTQALLQLRTMNPAVITKGAADQCKWAADTIELLARYVYSNVDLMASLRGRDERIYALVCNLCEGELDD